MYCKPLKETDRWDSGCQKESLISPQSQNSNALIAYSPREDRKSGLVPSLILVRLLEGGEEPGPLSLSLAESPRPNPPLNNLIASLSSHQRQVLKKQWGAKALEELNYLSRERGPELFYEGLLNFGRRQVNAGEIEIAAQVFSFLTTSQGESKSSQQECGALAQHAQLPCRTPGMTPLSIQNQAKRELDAIMGKGSIGARAEFLTRGFVKGATDPSLIFAFGVAGATFKAVRLATLSRLLNSPVRNFFTQGFGARATASLAGFAAEAPIFPAAGNVGSVVLGREVSWSNFDHQVASSVFILGGLKLTGWGAGALFNKIHGINPLTGQALHLTGLAKFSKPVFPQVGMLGGIILGHKAEEWANLRDPVDGATTITDSLATLFQLNIAGSLLRRGLPGIHTWERGLELETYRLAREGAKWTPPWVPSPLVGEGGLQLVNNIAGRGLGTARPMEVYLPEPGMKARVMEMSILDGKTSDGLSKKTNNLDKGAVAIGGEYALDWLLNIRRILENHPDPNFPRHEVSLYWVPKTPLQTVLLNEFGVFVRQGRQEIEVINQDGKIPIWAELPFLEPGVSFITIKNFEKGVGKMLEEWQKREERGMTKLLPWKRFHQQLEKVSRRREGIQKISHENKKRYIVFNNGEKEILHPPFKMYPDLEYKSVQATGEVLKTFQNQFWEKSPEQMEDLLGPEVMKQLPDHVIVTQYQDSRIIIGPNYGQSLKGITGARIFFRQGIKEFWVGDPSGERNWYATKEFPSDRFQFLKNIASPFATTHVELPGKAWSEVYRSFAQGTPAQSVPGQAIPEEIPTGKDSGIIKTNPTTSPSTAVVKADRQKGKLPPG